MKAYRQTFKGPIEGFVVNYIKGNYWRVKNVVSEEDVKSDAFKLYAEAFEKYYLKGNVDNPAWFMALFKRIFINYFNAISNISTFLNSFESLDDIEENAPGFLANKFVDYNLGDLTVKLSEAPKEVKELLELLIDDPKYLNKLEKIWRQQGKYKTSGNEFLCRVLGYDPLKINLIDNLVNYLIDKE